MRFRGDVRLAAALSLVGSFALAGIIRHYTGIPMKAWLILSLVIDFVFWAVMLIIGYVRGGRYSRDDSGAVVDMRGRQLAWLLIGMAIIVGNICAAAYLPDWARAAQEARRAGDIRALMRYSVLAAAQRRLFFIALAELATVLFAVHPRWSGAVKAVGIVGVWLAVFVLVGVTVAAGTY